MIRWTPELDAKGRRLWMSGAHIDEIAAATGASTNGIYKHASARFWQRPADWKPPSQGRWTAAMDEAGRALWQDGVSAREIAAHLGLPGRGAVIGRAHRERWPTPVTKHPRQRRRPRRLSPILAPLLPPAPASSLRPTVAVLAPPPVRKPSSKPVPFLDSGFGQCRYITAERPWFICGAPTVCNTSWCVEHSRACLTASGLERLGL